MKRTYDVRSRVAPDLEAFLGVWPDEWDEVAVAESPDGQIFHVTVSRGEARAGFNLDRRDLDAFLHIKGVRETIAAQDAAHEAAQEAYERELDRW